MLETLALIDRWDVYAWQRDFEYAEDLPLVAILNDPSRAPLPVKPVRALLSRGLIQEVNRGDDSTIAITPAGRELLNLNGVQ